METLPDNQHLGYIKLFRSLLDSRAFANPELLKVWIWCLLKANHKPEWVSVQVGKGMTEVQVLRGEFLFGRERAGAELSMNPSKVYSLVKKLHRMGNVELVGKGYYSKVKVQKFENYQGEGQRKETRDKSVAAPIDQSPAEQLLSPGNQIWLEQLAMKEQLKFNIREIVEDYSLKLEERGEDHKDLKQLRAGLQRHITFWKKRKQRFDEPTHDQPLKTIPKTW